MNRLVNDDELLRTLGSWLRDSDIAAPEARASVEPVLARASRTVQHRRRLARWLASGPGPTVRHGERSSANALSLFPALKLFAATVVVALFGGMLLLSITSTLSEEEAPPAAGESPSPSGPVDRQAVLEFEDVEPGVRRVVSDGIRVLRWQVPPSWGGYEDDAFGAAGVGNISAGPAGTVWVAWMDELLRLGDQRTQAWPADGIATVAQQLAVAPDGRLWHASYDDLVSYGSDGARIHEAPVGREVFWDVDIARDGSVWALTSMSGSTVGRYDRSGWHVAAARPPDEGRALAVDHHGGLWLVTASHEGSPRRLLRYVDGSWLEVETPGIDWAFDLSDDGTPWLGLFERFECRPESCWRGPMSLARFDGQEWIRYGAAEGIPALGPSSYLSVLDPVAAPDGSVWLKPAADATVKGTDCAGVANFDGQDWRHYLTDHCIYALDVAPDGSLWALAGEREAWGPRERKRPERNTALQGAPAGPVELYVIGSIGDRP
jgi:hypothetical protein